MEKTKLPAVMLDNTQSGESGTADFPLSEGQATDYEPNPNLQNEMLPTPDGGTETPEEEHVLCPNCSRPRRAFTIVDDKCDSCRAEDERPQMGFTLGWPEVRYRRNMMLAGTDPMMLEDREEALKTQARPLRQALRDITEHPTPLEAWTALDVLEAQIAEITS